MEPIVKKFDELTVAELYEILKIRAEVFVVEQNCVYQDLDEVDKEAYHVYLKDNGQIVAYLRVVDKGKRLDEVSVGRVISLKRRCGVGSALMKAGMIRPPLASTNSASGYLAFSSAVVPTSLILVPSITTPPSN